MKCTIKHRLFKKESKGTLITFKPNKVMQKHCLSKLLKFHSIHLRKMTVWYSCFTGTEITKLREKYGFRFIKDKIITKS